jgi:hypothetical protein
VPGNGKHHNDQKRQYYQHDQGKWFAVMASDSPSGHRLVRCLLFHSNFLQFEAFVP